MDLRFARNWLQSEGENGQGELEIYENGKNTMLLTRTTALIRHIIRTIDIPIATLFHWNALSVIALPFAPGAGFVVSGGGGGRENNSLLIKGSTERDLEDKHTTIILISCVFRAIHMTVTASQYRYAG